MRVTTVVAIGFGIAVGFTTCWGTQVVSQGANRLKAAVEQFSGTQAVAFAAFAETVAPAAKQLDDEISVALRSYVDSGQYQKADAVIQQLAPLPFSNPSTLKSMAAKKLAWCCVPGIYKVDEPGPSGRQIVLGRDGRFELQPYDESGWSGEWLVTDGILVLKSDRGWEKKLQLVPQFSNQDLSLRWQKDIQSK
jgi:hypothetical protein